MKENTNHLNRYASIIDTWKPQGDLLKTIDTLMRTYHHKVDGFLKPLVRTYFPDLLENESGSEYNKLVALSTKMTLVAHACTEVTGHDFDARRQRIGILYGACCFLGDSFLDDFGDEASREYLERYERLLTKGWFEVRNEREKLFYVIISRLFSERDILEPMLRQSIFWLYLAQRKDVELRLAHLKDISRRKLLNVFRKCARDRSGHAITVLALLLVPRLPLKHHNLIFTAGSLIMFIDDHGDCHFDRFYKRTTYMNMVRNPAQALSRIFMKSMQKIEEGFQKNNGYYLLSGFLYRYFVTRLEKHKLEKNRGQSMWTVYE